MQPTGVYVHHPQPNAERPVLSALPPPLTARHVVHRIPLLLFFIQPRRVGDFLTSKLAPSKTPSQPALQPRQSKQARSTHFHTRSRVPSSPSFPTSYFLRKG